MGIAVCGLVDLTYPVSLWPTLCSIWLSLCLRSMLPPMTRLPKAVARCWCRVSMLPAFRWTTVLVFWSLVTLEVMSVVEVGRLTRIRMPACSRRSTLLLWSSMNVLLKVCFLVALPIRALRPRRHLLSMLAIGCLLLWKLWRTPWRTLSMDLLICPKLDGNRLTRLTRPVQLLSTWLLEVSPILFLPVSWLCLILSL